MELNLDLPSPDDIAQDVEKNGFCIYRKAVGAELIDEMRRFWFDYFEVSPIQRKFVRGELYLGEQNFNSYSRINDWCMYRHFDFLWNAGPHQPTRQLQLAVHRHRNLAQGFDEAKGLDYNESNYGIYISTSYYPPGRGFLKVHSDGHQATPILHYMLPLTFKGVDYAGGGLRCENKQGELVDVDAGMSKGDIVFFDGRQQHGVDVIVPNHSGPAVGRLAIFAIPTFFLRDTRLGVAKRSARIALFELANVLRLKDLKKLGRGRSSG